MASGEAGVPVPKTLRIKLKLNGRVVKNAALHSAEQAVGEIGEGRRGILVSRRTHTHVAPHPSQSPM